MANTLLRSNAPVQFLRLQVASRQFQQYINPQVSGLPATISPSPSPTCQVLGKEAAFRDARAFPLLRHTRSPRPPSRPYANLGLYGNFAGFFATSGIPSNDGIMHLLVGEFTS
jgi:hypothetical protein